ncbi:hydroxymethylpyrimidine/phosphomethylpyrimidine kinase [Undibacterium sp. 5I1]|uniref:bifunctional hydroxymethylpyrimidine kinase/phosphomethylpyrimidine kinase n=1 Tax=unclassified Undibacterium TaxID=2630295 RepID=UPI002AB4A1A5|nr:MULTISPECIES: hydroxymethylpyrimidine/phosphomethylpyrimidine kinase [unclassified Undibacterium]MDY7539222.1 hydroxymethylpyrimidine/phosphomethylpyrimidine kinase [Undibacterium sp. 5I1]MEB0231106.1 hydroxymethylpyrimidine/phosphomethylpyrimidine kinase [Undibacterium sp. 10I3]MEB0256979.1 hydroxymethylpyrimidine/phosphomethylpyrimidine kinase [Undibacterium sp. 5I1]
MLDQPTNQPTNQPINAAASFKTRQRPCVLVFAGHDPSGGAGIQADSEAIAAQGAHALTIITALTVQDNDRVFAVHVIEPDIIRHQVRVLLQKCKIAAIKIGVVGHRANAECIAELVAEIVQSQPGTPDIPVILDPVLSSGHGDVLLLDDAPDQVIQPLLEVATLITPNMPEVQRLCPTSGDIVQQARQLLQFACRDVFIKGGHGSGRLVNNHWFANGHHQQWQWDRLPASYHGSGCTLASAIAGQLAAGASMGEALENAQRYTQDSLAQAYAIAPGQLIPCRI